jgi:hypothetical protein
MGFDFVFASLIGLDGFHGMHDKEPRGDDMPKFRFWLVSNASPIHFFCYIAIYFLILIILLIRFSEFTY